MFQIFNVQTSIFRKPLNLEIWLVIQKVFSFQRRIRKWYNIGGVLFKITIHDVRCPKWDILYKLRECQKMGNLINYLTCFNVFSKIYYLNFNRIYSGLLVLTVYLIVNQKLFCMHTHFYADSN